MRYRKGSTPRLAYLLKGLAPYVRKYGRLSGLASFCGCHVQAAHTWFWLGNGRPPAPYALRALRWIEETSRKPILRFIPDWEDLRGWAAEIIRNENSGQELADYASSDLPAVQKYLLSKNRNRTRPDGEFALAVLEWYCWSRTAYRRHGQITPRIREVLEAEQRE